MFLKTYTRSLPLLHTKSLIFHTFYYSGSQRKPLSTLNLNQLSSMLRFKSVELNVTHCLCSFEHNITPSLLMIIALIRGNCLALSVSCYIGVLHRSIHLALPWRILQIDSLAFLVRRLLLFDMNWNRTLCRELIYLMKSQ